MKPFFAILALAFLPGCASLIPRQETVTAVASHPIIATVETVPGPGPIVWRTNYVVSETWQTNQVTNTTFVVNPKVETVLQTASTITAAIPFPWSGALATGFAGLSAVLGLIARAKNSQAALIPTIIQGIEGAANNADVKKTVENIARATGQQTRLNALVQKITG